MDVIMKPRTDGVEKAIQDCAAGLISYWDCCRKINAMGFGTKGVYEAVCNAEKK